ncbi:MAG: 2,3-bisphosphoglycerate-independent phosphoglycerate mutase [Firmicutes bacterium]|nr:2,3-bisphosphoglycerate-independent phosphoglycerate mutase [Bacillota bacterium]
MTKNINKTVLCIIDGLGMSDKTHGNAVHAAGMKNLWNAYENFLSTNLVASGPEVGLVSESDAGSSEVGHNAIGAGQRIKQGLALLDDAFETGEVFKSETWKKIVANSQGKKLQIIHLLSNGRTHSDINHLFYTLKQCVKDDVTVSIHALADGRDVTAQSVLRYIKQTNELIKEYGVNARIATVAGRAVAFMDRYDSNPQALTTGFEVIVEGKAPITNDIEKSVESEYEKAPTMTDERLSPFVLEPDWLVQNGEPVLLLNYRGDRALQTCALFKDGKYITKDQFKKIDKCMFVGLMEYDSELKIPDLYLCPPPNIDNTLSHWLCEHSLRQLTVAETVKFGHITYFFNGNRGKPIDDKLEKWIEIDGHKVGAAYDTVPQMRAKEIADTVIGAIKSGEYDFIKFNLANPDMVGHTGNFDATVIACKTVDECLGKIIKLCSSEKINFVITSDHGNAEEMIDKNGKMGTTHTSNQVPFIAMPFAGGKFQVMDGQFGLTNIAATICDLMGIEPSLRFNESIIKR